MIKHNSKLPTIVTLIITVLVMVLGNTHMCLLHSTIVEIAMLILIVAGFSFWTTRANEVGKAWLCTGISLVMAIALQSAYLTWLHLEYFPKALLSRKSIEWQAQINDETSRIIKATETETKDCVIGGQKFNIQHPTWR